MRIFGGTDPYHLLVKLLKAYMELKLKDRVAAYGVKFLSLPVIGSKYRIYIFNFAEVDIFQFGAAFDDDLIKPRYLAGKPGDRAGVLNRRHL